MAESEGSLEAAPGAAVAPRPSDRPTMAGTATDAVALDMLEVSAARLRVDARDLPSLLGAVLDAGSPAEGPHRAVEAARLFDLWCRSHFGRGRPAGTGTAHRALLECSGPGIETIGRSLFVGGVGGPSKPLSKHDSTRAWTDLARGAELLGDELVDRVAEPLFRGVLAGEAAAPSPPGARLGEGRRRLENAIRTSVEEGEGVTLVVALVEACRRSSRPGASRLADAVGAAGADGAQALLMAHEQASRAMQRLERSAGTGGLEIPGLDVDQEAERALLSIEDRGGVLARYETLAGAVSRTVRGLRRIPSSAPGMTLEFGAGRLAELARDCDVAAGAVR